MAPASTSSASTALESNDAARRGTGLIFMAVCTLLYVSGSHSFAFLIFAVLLLAPDPMHTPVDAFRRRVPVALRLISMKCEERSHTPAFKIGLAAGLIIVLFPLAFLGGGAWIVSELSVAYQLLVEPSPEYVFLAGIIFSALLQISRKKFRRGRILVLLGVPWVMTHESVTLFLNKIGVDSLIEAGNFDVQEAAFWLSTLDEAIFIKVNINELLVCAAMSTLGFYCLKRLLAGHKYSKQKSPLLKVLVSVLLMSSGIYLTISDSLAMFMSSSKDFLDLSENFSGVAPMLVNDQKKMNVLVYIGESTSVMNMGLYGYPRNTTPRLAELAKYDDNLIVFKNVFSTHVHTSPSLLEALSFGVDERDRVLPINERKRISVVDVVKRQGAVQLYSNQGASGSYNQASSVIFKNAERMFAAQTSLLGNSDAKVPRPAEDQFFKKINLAGLRGKSLVFLHSYAGHGPYLANIPEAFRAPVDATYAPKNSQAVMGNHASITTVDNYDSAIRYIDFSVSALLLKVKDSPDPSVVLYFSDHGDAVYAGRGHDSARLVHEMMRVPFLIYFNDAARKAYPEKYASYLALSRQGNVSTLAQLPSTIIDLMGLKLSKNDRNPVLEKPLIGASTLHDPIVVRRTAKEVSYINVDDTPGFASTPSQVLTDATDQATRIFKARNAYKKSATKFCHHGSNSLAKAIRAGLLTDCVEIDLAAQQEGAAGSVPVFSEIYAYAAKNKMAIWIDGTNVGSKAGCRKAVELSTKHSEAGDAVLVEFPSGADESRDVIIACVDALKQRRIAVAYHVSLVDAISCSSAIKAGKASTGELSCNRLKHELERAAQSGLFTDFSFPYGGLMAMEALESAAKLKWNIWGVPIENVSKLGVDRFRMITLSNVDPNTP